MPKWDDVHMIDGWVVQQTSAGIELTASLWAYTREAFPVRGDVLPAKGPCRPQTQYLSYRIREITTTQLTGAGPFLASVTAGHSVGATTAGRGDRLLDQTSLRTGYADFQILPEWCGLRPAPGTTTPKRLRGEWDTGKWASAIAPDPSGTWDAWLDAYDSGRSIEGSPFRRIINPHFADTTQRFLQATATCHFKETSSGLERWGGFQGIVPANSFPSWLSLPGGDNRWRLYDEEIEQLYDNDGRTRLLKATRTLLGVPPSVTDSTGNRAQWDQTTIGQRDWSDL